MGTGVPATAAVKHAGLEEEREKPSSEGLSLRTWRDFSFSAPREKHSRKPSCPRCPTKGRVLAGQKAWVLLFLFFLLIFFLLPCWERGAGAWHVCVWTDAGLCMCQRRKVCVLRHECVQVYDTVTVCFWECVEPHVTLCA